MRKHCRVFILLSIITVLTGLSQLCSVGLSKAEVISFDDLPEVDNDLSQVPPGYKGLTWGVSYQNVFGGGYEFGRWHYRSYYSYRVALPMPHSSPNYVFNSHGANNLWFSFAKPVTFNGAWFSYFYKPTSAVAVRFKDNQGNVSPWLDLSERPQFLAANFSGSKKIFVETSEQNGLEPFGSEWYSIDDITFNEPFTPVFIPEK